MVRDPWLLVTRGEFHRADQAYTEEIESRPSCPLHISRGTVRLTLGLYPEAISDFEAAISLSTAEGTCSTLEYARLGAALWLSGETAAAISAWKNGLPAKYVDIGGGVELPLLLLYAAVRTGDSALKSWVLKKLGKIRMSRNIPGPLAAMQLGRISPHELRRYVSSNPTLAVREWCQGDFHLGVYALRCHRPDIFRECMRNAALAKPIARLHTEYYLARAEYPVSFVTRPWFTRLMTPFRRKRACLELSRLKPEPL